MVLIKNVAITSKRYQYLKTQQYTILTKVIDEATQVVFLSYTTNYQLFDLH